MVSKDLVREKFSRYAKTYDTYSSIQRRMASFLISLMPLDGVRKILEIGCGTGNLTLLLKKRFKKANLLALDISEEMIRVAKGKLEEGVDFVVGDGETMRLNDAYDLIASNATFQWFHKLNETLTIYRDLLTDGGSIFFSTFGPMTFHELGYSMMMVMGKEVPSEGFLDKGRLLDIMMVNFKGPRVIEWTFKEIYPSLVDLLRTIKYTGESGNCIKGLMTRDSIHRIERAYLERFGRIEVTYQVFFSNGKR